MPTRILPALVFFCCLLGMPSPNTPAQQQASDSNRLELLKKERLDLLKERLKLLPEDSFETLLRAQQDVFDAELALSTTDEECKKLLQRHWEIYVAMEERAQFKQQQGRRELKRSDILLLKSMRIGAEINLQIGCR